MIDYNGDDRARDVPGHDGSPIQIRLDSNVMTLSGSFRRLRALVIEEALQAQGFMRLLMKPRNGQAWSPDERRQLRCHLRRLARSLPVLGIFALPGGGLLLPLLAWLLDRRRRNHGARTLVPDRRSSASADQALTGGNQSTPRSVE